MIEDMNLLSNGLTLQADLCIIGAGAAGILIAREFLGTNRKIVLLESGGIRSEITARHLHEGEVHDRSFRGLQNGRSRGFGGTTTLWGGQCIPLDPIDFEERPWVPSSGWPISANKLGPYYARAKRALEITNADADRSAWEQFGLDPILYDQATLRPIHGVFIKRPDLGRRFHKEFSNAQHIHVLLHANVTQLRTNGYGTRIETAEIRSLDGKVGIVHAGLFVLCTGGIENARMLLLSNEINPSGLGNGRDLVGRYFQDHPCGRCATIETDRPKVLQNHYNLLYSRTARYFPKIALSETIQRRAQVLNCVGRLEYEFDPTSGLQSLRDIRDAARAGRWPEDAMIKALRVGCAMPQFASATWRFIARGLSPAPEPREIHLEAFSEQAPDRDSRILLSEATDALGLRKARVDWRVSELTSRTIAVFADSVRAEFDRLGLGRVCVSDWVDASSAPSSHFVDTYHHAGTTRMASSPYEGVVDTDCQVFGVEGLFIAGSSVFPTSGAANPVLTIAALAIRVADKLKAKLGFAGWSASDEIPADRPLRAPAYAASRQLD